MQARHRKSGDAQLHGSLKARASVANPMDDDSKSGRNARPFSFAGHYGQLIITDGIAPIPRALYLYQGALNLSPQQVWFISYVLAHKWDEDLPHPRLQELARHATLGLRQIKNIKNSLVYAGLLEVRSRYGAEGEQDANSYDFGLLFEKLENLIVSDSAAPLDELADEPLSGEPVQSAVYDHGPQGDANQVATGTPRKDYSFAARYGRIVLRRGIAAMPRALFTYQVDLGLSAQQMWFIGYILSFQWSTELPYPSLRKMAANTGYSERQIHRIKDTLVRAGYLRLVERRGIDGRDTTSAYDFSELLKTLNTSIHKHSSATRGKATRVRGLVEDGEGGRGMQLTEFENVQLALHKPQPEPLQAGGEIYVSGGVNSLSVAREPQDSGWVNHTSERGVKPVSVGRVKHASYEIESIKEESDKEETHQQHPPTEIEIDQAQENAYYALVDVGVIPSIALEITHQLAPDEILGWVRYYLSVLSRQDNLSNPIGVLVSRLRSGEEPPYVPSPGDLHSLHLRLQWGSMR